MANSKKSSSSSSSSSSSKSTSSKSTNRSSWGLNKISFWTIVAVTILYAISLVLTAIGTDVLMTVVRVLQGLATAIMICIVAVLAWRYVKSKPVIWKVLYVICLLIVVAGIIIPMVK